MNITRIKRYTLILCYNVLFFSLATSCSNGGEKTISGYSTHIENTNCVKVEFCTPDNYTKELRKQRACTPFFCDKTIVLNGSVIYFSPDECRSFVSLSVTDKTNQLINNKDYYEYNDSTVVRSLFCSDLDWDVRLPLIYKNVDDDGNVYYCIMKFTRYSHSEPDCGNAPVVEDNGMPMDSVESDCYYYSVINNKEIVIEYYMLQSIEDFSFMDIFSMLQSVKVYSK